MAYGRIVEPDLGSILVVINKFHYGSLLFKNAMKSKHIQPPKMGRWHACVCVSFAAVCRMWVQRVAIWSVLVVCCHSKSSRPHREREKHIFRG